MVTEIIQIVIYEILAIRVVINTLVENKLQYMIHNCNQYYSTVVHLLIIYVVWQYFVIEHH